MKLEEFFERLQVFKLANHLRMQISDTHEIPPAIKVARAGNCSSLDSIDRLTFRDSERPLASALQLVFEAVSSGGKDELDAKLMGLEAQVVPALERAREIYHLVTCSGYPDSIERSFDFVKLVGASHPLRSYDIVRTILGWLCGADLPAAWRASPSSRERPALETEGLITIAVATNRYQVTGKTLLRQVKKGMIASRRPPEAGRTSRHLLREKDIAALYPRRLEPN